MKVVTSCLTIGDKALPDLQQEQALVRVRYFGISQEDLRLHGLGVPSSKLGTEFSGEIVKLESQTSLLRTGDHVFGFISSGGAMAEYVACDSRLLVKVPNGLNLAEAATIPDMWISALRLFKQDAEVAKRNRIAVYNAMSQTGQALTQLAQLLGCRRVHCITKSKRAADELMAHLRFPTALMDEVVPHDGSQGSVHTMSVIAKFDPRGLEAVIDLGAESHIVPEMMRPRGTIAVAAKPLTTSSKDVDWELFCVKNLTLRGASIRSDKPDSNVEHLNFMAKHVVPKIVHGKIFHRVFKTYKWEQVSDAFSFVASNSEMLGRVVCSIE